MEVFIDMHTLAELIGVTHDTARRFRYGKGKGPDWRKPTGFPKPWGEIQRPGARGRGSAVFPLSEVLDWLAKNRPYDLRIVLEFGNIGQEWLDDRGYGEAGVATLNQSLPAPSSRVASSDST